MQKIVSGIVVWMRTYSDNNVLIGVLLENSQYIKKYCQMRNHKCALGQQIVLKIYGEQQNKIFIESIENSMLQIFWNNSSVLSELLEIFKVIDKVPQNIKIDSLYDKFLQTIQSIENKKSTDDFKKYLKSLMQFKN